MLAIPRSEWLEPATKGDLVLLHGRLELERERRLTDLTFKLLNAVTIFLFGASTTLWIVALAIGK
jgi:hypothetical protein